MHWGGALRPPFPMGGREGLDCAQCQVVSHNYISYLTTMLYIMSAENYDNSC